MPFFQPPLPTIQTPSAIIHRIRIPIQAGLIINHLSLRLKSQRKGTCIREGVFVQLFPKSFFSSRGSFGLLACLPFRKQTYMIKTKCEYPLLRHQRDLSKSHFSLLPLLAIYRGCCTMLSIEGAH